MLVRAPASSANLGPGFDCLALALDLPFWLAVDDPTVKVPGSGDELSDADTTHPASTAFSEAGGDPSARLRWCSAIPPGRGLGFSGAARVAGAFAARIQAGDTADTARAGAREVATRLEGHGDNAAASAHGSLTVVAGDEVVVMAPPAQLRVLAWSPSDSTSTDASRSTLGDTVPLQDAAFSIARAALWVAAVATGRTEALRAASQDRVHQPARLAGRPDAAAAVAVLTEHQEVVAAWLSGSGPTVAALVPRHGGGRPSAEDFPGLPEGTLRLLEYDLDGVVVVSSGDSATPGTPTLPAAP